MKRVLTALLLIALVVTCFAFASCGGNGEAHVHTFKDTWSNDASGHWYEPTCECTEDLRVVLAHVDNNNDGACDICTYTDHQHTYSEGYTADCTNHWNAADCGHTVAGANVEAHIDETGDGVCDVCKYVIEDLHEHIYSAEWDGDGEYHWHNAICEHKVEVSGKEGHIINDAGYCTVCNKQIKEVDKTDILAVLKAAIANNYKVVTGTVIADEMLYGAGAALETGKTNKVFFVLGNGDSYVEWGSYNKTGEFTGVDEYYLQTLENGTIFAVQIPYYDGNKRNDELKMFPVDGDPMKLNGYNYTPGAILAAYDDTETLAQTIANLYDILVKNVNVSNPQSGYDAETGKYTFSYGFFSVNETSGSTSLDGTGEDVVSYYVEYYDVKVEFTVDENLVINNATFSVDSYRNLEGVDEDLEYDPVENKVTFLPGKSATTYTYTVAQTSGERTYTTIYPKASLIPQGFDLLTGTPVKDPDTLSTIGFTDKKPLGDKLVINKKVYTYIVLGDPYPITSSFSFLNTEDISVSWVNNTQGSSGAMATMEPYFNWSAGYIAFFPKDDGSYTLTIKIGDVTKSIIVEIGEADLVAPDDTDDTKYVVVKDPNGWDAEYTYEAKEAGTYTFTIPANLGFVVKNAQTPVADPFDPEYEAKEYTYEVDLAKGEKLTFNVGAEQKGVFAIGVAFVAGEVVGPGEGGEGGDNPPAEEIDIIGTYTNGKDLTVVIDDTNAVFTTSKGSTTARYEISNGKVILYNDTLGTIWGSALLAINITNGEVTDVVYNGTAYTVSKQTTGDDSGDEGDDGDELKGSGTENDPYVITAGDYVAPFKGGSDLVYYSFTTTESGFITINSTFDGTPWLYLGAESNEGYLTTLTAFVPAGGTIIMQVGDWDEQANDVPFTVSFEAKASDDFSALVGTWYGASEGWTTINYTLVINADGTGSISYDMGNGATTYNVEYVFVEGQKVTIGYKTSSGSAAIECTYDGTTFACTKGVMQDDFVFTTEQPSGGDDETGIFAGGEIFEGTNIVTITADDKAAGTITLTIVATKTTNYYFRSGSLMVNKVTGPDGDVEKFEYKYAFVEGNEYTLTISMNFISNPGDYEINVTTPNYVEPVDYTADVLGGYENVNGYNISIGENFGIANAGDYIAEIYKDDYTIDLFFTVVATPNGDGSYTLALEYFSHTDYEIGAENVDVILAETFIVTPGAGEEGGDDEVQTGLAGLINTYVDEALNGLNVGFFNENGVYYLNVYGGGFDLYYTCDATENADGSVTLVLTFDADNESYLEEQTDAYELDGVTVVAAVVDNSWTFAVEGSEPVVPQGPSGSFADPFELVEENTCNFPGGWNYIFYKYTAETAGNLTINVTSGNAEWAYGFEEFAMSFVTGSTETIELSANQVVYIGMSTANPYGAGVIDFTATFVESEEEPEEPAQPDGTEQNPFALVMGENELLYQGFAYAWALYKFEAPEAGTLVITMTSNDYDLGYGSAPMRMSGSQSSPLSINLEAGQIIWVGITTKLGSQSSTPITFTASFGNGEGDDVVEEPVKEAELVLGNNSVNSENINFVYNATADIEIQLAVGTASGDTVNVKYAVNDGTAIAIANGSTVKVKLTNGDKLTVYAETNSGFLTITASEVVKEVEGPTLSGTGTKKDPFIIDTLPLEINFSGKHDKYYKFTATADGVLLITYTDGGLVSDLPNYEKDGEKMTYTVNVKAGDSFVVNIWTMRSAGEFKYTFTMVESSVTPDPEEPGEGGGEATGSEEVYIGSGNGRGIKVIINKAADTLVIIRAVSGLTNFEGGTTYNLVYSEILGNAVDGVYPGFIPNTSIMNLKFDENGAVSEFAWNGTTYKDFVKQ